MNRFLICLGLLSLAQGARADVHQLIQYHKKCPKPHYNKLHYIAPKLFRLRACIRRPLQLIYPQTDCGEPKARHTPFLCPLVDHRVRADLYLQTKPDPIPAPALPR